MRAWRFYSPTCTRTRPLASRHGSWPRYLVITPQARLLAAQATELRLGGELDRALAELKGWQAGGKDT